MNARLKVGVLYGGWSSERSVSLNTGRAIESALETLGHNPVMIDVGKDLIDVLKRVDVDVCYNALHGTFGEDGQLQGILDFLGMPYTGEDARTSLVAFDKLLSKSVYLAEGVSTPPSMLLNSATDLTTIGECFSYPVFIKPSSEGSSVGVEKIDSEAELRQRAGHWQSTPYLLEAAVAGAELSVACWDDRVLGSVEIVPERAFYDFEAKYGSAGTTYYVPPRLDPQVVAIAEAAALKAHRALGCRSLCRTDVMVTDQQAYVLETNTLPGMTETSLVPKIARAQGIEFPDLVQMVLGRAKGLTEGVCYE